MFRPLGFLFVAKVASERFLTPGTIARVGDGGEGGDGFVFAGIFEELRMRRVGMWLAMMFSLSSSSLVYKSGKQQKKIQLTKVKAPCPPIL